MMKSLYLITVLLLTSIIASSQTADLTFFTELGENFTVYINGEQKNEVPANNVKMPGITESFFQIRIDFEETSLPDFSKNGGVELGTSSTFMIKPNKKGKYVVRLFNTQPLGETSSEETRPISYSNPQVEPATTTITSSPSTTHIQVTETTTTSPTNSGESVEINMSIDGVGISLDMNIDGADMEQSATETTTIMTTTRSSNSATYDTSSTHSTNNTAKAEPVVYAESGCMSAMSGNDFKSALSSIEDKSFEDSKLTIAKQVSKSNCLNSVQVKEIMLIFSFEDTRLEFAKFAYDHTMDQGNYYLVNDAFDFEMTIGELDTYIQGR
jgi:hypothetical protein